MEFSQEKLRNLGGDRLAILASQGNQAAAVVLHDRYVDRLLALIRARLSTQLRRQADPADVVQSAFASFFRFLEVNAGNGMDEGDSSLWPLLSTFARRKLARLLERFQSQKRGHTFKRVSLERIDCENPQRQTGDYSESEESLPALFEQLDDDERGLLSQLVEGATQKEIANDRKVSVRTVRRRLNRIRTKAGGLQQKEQLRIPHSLPNIPHSNFILNEFVGAGTFGKVYRATARDSNQILAVKFLRKKFWANAKAKQMLLDEAAKAARISNTGISKVFGWGQYPGGGTYLVSEWISGHTLQECVGHSSAEKAGYLCQLIDAVNVIHANSLIHCDLKPSNILIDEDGMVRVTDFGFACSFGASSEEKASLKISGTPGFAAPEQFACSFGAMGYTTDVFAIGAIAFWLLTGKNPFSSDGYQTTEGLVQNTLSDTDVEIAGEYEDANLKRIANVARLALKKAVSERAALGTLQAVFR